MQRIEQAHNSVNSAIEALNRLEKLEFDYLSRVFSIARQAVEHQVIAYYTEIGDHEHSIEVYHNPDNGRVTIVWTLDDKTVRIMQLGSEVSFQFAGVDDAFFYPRVRKILRCPVHEGRP